MPDYAAITSPAEAASYIEKCLDSPLCGVDTETTGVERWHDTIVGVCLSATAGEGRYIPIAHTGEGTNVPWDAIVEPLVKLVSNASMAMHNAPYDVFMLWRHLKDYADCPEPWEFDVAFDTQLAAQVLGERNEAGSDRSSGLKALGKKFLGVDRPDFAALFPPEVKKKDRSFAALDIDLATPYAAADPDDTLSLVPVLHNLLSRNDVLPIFEGIEMPLLKEMLWMEARGVLVDTENSERQSKDARAFAEEAEAAVIDRLAERIGSRTITMERTRAGEKVQVEEELEIKNSHLSRVLFDDDMLGLPVMDRTPKGAPSVAEASLEKLAAFEPAIAWVLEVRGALKVASTYLDAWPKHAVIETEVINQDWDTEDFLILHPNYKQLGTETGRQSSSGPNVQNAPKSATFGDAGDGEPMIPGVLPVTLNARDMIVPRPGYYFLEMDWAQVEARVIAGFSGEPVLLDTFARNIDYHIATYSAMTGTPIEEVTKAQRAQGKTLNYALGFGAGADKLAEMLGVSRDEARDLIAAYWSGLPHYAAWKDGIERFAQQNRYVSTYFGRKRWLNFGGEGISEAAARQTYFAALREAVNTPIQGTAADLLKIMMVRLGPWLREYFPRVRTVFTTHDSVTFEVPEDIDSHYMAEVLDPVCRFDQDFIPGWPAITCDFEVGDRWGSLTEDKDEIDDISEVQGVVSSNPQAPVAVQDVVAPASQHLVLQVPETTLASIAPGAMTELRDLIISMQGAGHNTLTVQLVGGPTGGGDVTFDNVSIGPDDGHLFAHLLGPEGYRLMPATDSSLILEGATT